MVMLIKGTGRQSNACFALLLVWEILLTRPRPPSVVPVVGVVVGKSLRQACDDWSHI